MASRQDVFVSYSHEDRAAVAQLVRALQVRGLSVRWDNDLQAGRNLDDQLTGLLTDAALVVVVWSEASAKSSFVLREAAAAEADGKLFPVSIDGSIPGAFRKLQTLMLTEWRGEADDPVIEGLASSLRDRLSGVVEDGPGSAPLQRGGPQPRYLDRVFSIDTLGSQGMRGAAVLISGETMVTSSASVQGLPFVSVHSLVSGSSGQAEVIPGDAADSIRAVAVLKPIGNLPATSDPLVLAVGPAARGQTVEVVALQPSGEPRVVRGSVVASDPKELRVELDPLPPDDVTAGAPIIAEGQVIGLAFERSGAQLLGVPSDVIRTAINAQEQQRNLDTEKPQESAAAGATETAQAEHGTTQTAPPEPGTTATAPLEPGSTETATAEPGTTSASAEGQSDAATRPEVRPQLLAGATADTVPRPGNGRVRRADRLGVTDEVEMLVSVLLAKDTPLPLAVGLFGDWGSGKSFFMALMEERMGELSTMAKEKLQEAKPYCGNVRTIRFNAWHYVDADLWASLAATLFDELARPTAAEEANQALVELGKARAEADRAKASRIELERRVDVLETRAGTAYAAWRPSLTVALHALREDKDLQSNLQDIAKGTGEPDADAARLADALGAAETLGEKARDVRRLLREEVVHRSRAATVVTFVVFLLVAVGAWWVLGLDAGQKALSVAIAVIAGLMPALGATSRIVHLAREARETRERPLEEKREELAKARGAEEVAQREVERREQELREMRDKGLQLQNFVRERAASADYRSRLGVISQVRRDFEQLVTLMPAAYPAKKTKVDAGSPKAKDEQQAALAAEVRSRIPEVERIVLFIDDLDRCPDDKVVEVLQAVHLLLAFELFIVVVGVDSRWLVRSLNAHFEKLLEEPAQYLEKIFQIPFILRRMSTGSYRDLIRELTPDPEKTLDATDGVRDPSRAAATSDLHGAPPAGGSAAPAATTADSEALVAPVPDAAATGSAQQPGVPTDSAEQPEEHAEDHVGEQTDGDTDEPTEAEVPPALPRSEALFVSPDERRLLGELDQLVLTPRSTKRLVNIYRMLRVSVPDNEISSFEPGPGCEFEVVIVLLGILVGRPADVAGVFSRLMAQPDDAVFTTFLEAEFPRVHAPLKELLEGLRPHGMEVYQRWAPRVARFSFRLAGGMPAAPQEREQEQEQEQEQEATAEADGAQPVGDVGTVA